MSTSQRVALWVTLVGVIAAAGYWYIEKQNERSAAVRRAKEAADIARAKAGPYVEFNKMISPTEKLSIVVVPHPWGAWMDKRCLIYLNAEHKTSTMDCAFESLPPDVRPSAGLFDDIVPPKGANQWDIVEDVPLSSLPPPR